MPITIEQESPNTPDAAALIAELDALLAPVYPRDSRHGFSVQRLVSEGVAFFVVRVDEELAACGGVLLVGNEIAELKRMYVRPAYRGRGLGKLLVDRLGGYAREHGLDVLRLETGVHQREAIGLYERAGFRRIPPFPPYTADPLSLCYEKRLSDASGAA